MKILFLAPEPFYEERGTPIAVDLALRVLSERGERVDLVTYHLGKSKVYPGVKPYRIPYLPFIRDVRPGFSWKKVICDLFVFARALSLVVRNRYDLVHAVEESVFMAMVFKFLFRLPYVYDMDSSVAEHLAERFRWPNVKGVFSTLEALAAKRATHVIAVCKSLGELARKYGARKVVLLPDISWVNGFSNGKPSLRSQFGIKNILLLYVGNLEPYQGIDLLIQSFRLAVKRGAQISLVIAGGKSEQISSYRAKVKGFDLEGQVHFSGPRPLSELGSLLHEADILVSPRIQGQNTGMKIYSYLHSGKPILATNLLCHTQVLNHENALLCNPEPRDFAEGLRQLVEDPDLGKRLGARGKELAETCYTFSAFQSRLNAIYDSIAVRNS